VGTRRAGLVLGKASCLGRAAENQGRDQREENEWAASHAISQRNSLTKCSPCQGHFD
jgi:hypothetical protein